MRDFFSNNNFATEVCKLGRGIVFYIVYISSIFTDRCVFAEMILCGVLSNWAGRTAYVSHVADYGSVFVSHAKFQ
jgi:hypothetical protein